jgi:REP element-mobilizing transposase RayT
LCVDGRVGVLANEDVFQRLVGILLESPSRYRWFGRRFVLMPDHLHLIAHQGHDAIRLGLWIKALKAVVSGLKPEQERPVRAPGLQENASIADAATAGHVSPPDSEGGPPRARVSPPGKNPRPHEFTRIPRSWRWQRGYHDHKFRTPESEARKWEYVCLNPVRYGLAPRPEDWPFGGEVFYDEGGTAELVRGTPPLLETGILNQDETKPGRGTNRPPSG